MSMRLQKFMQQCGVASRRKAEELIVQGDVSVNGKVITELGTKINPEVDQVHVSGICIHKDPIVYIKLNKPNGYISSTTSKQGKSVLDLVKSSVKLFPVGRLDKESEGLVILTNDGDYANKIMHPRYGHQKEYIVEIDKPLTDEAVDALRDGPLLDGDDLNPMLLGHVRKNRTHFHLTLSEGKNRQIRRVLGQLGYKVLRLERIRINNIKLGELESGDWEYFSP